MFTPIGRPRNLPFPLYNQVTNGNTIDPVTESVGGSFVWPEDSTERVIFPLYLSLDEYVALSSAIDVGADIAYPEQFIEVLHIWMRQGMDICAIIANCIATSEAAQDALRGFITSDPEIRDYLDTVVSEGAPMSDETFIGEMVTSEDLDALFGAVTYLVDTMNGANEDLYQAIEASSNNREGGQILFESIPIFETLPLDEISEYVDFMVSSVAENYASQYTTTPITGLRDRIRCALFCLARNNGNSLSWEMIAEYFWGEVGFTLGNLPEVIGDFVEFVTTGSWSGEEIATISFANIASVLSGAQSFANMTFPNLQAIMLLGLNDPDPDWEILCEDCDEPPPPDPECVDFTEDDYDWAPEAGTVWVDGSGFTGDYNAGFNTTLLRVLRGAQTGEIAKVIVTFTIAQTDVFLQMGDGSGYTPLTGALGTTVEFSSETVVGWTNRNAALGVRIGANMAGDTENTAFFTIACVYPPEE